MKITYLDEPTFLPDEFRRRMATLGEFSVYHDRPDPETAIQRLNECDIAIVEWTRLSAEILGAVTRARYITLVTTSYDFVDLRAAGKAGITVAYCPGYSSQAVAEHVFALLLAVSRRLFAGDASVRRGDTIAHAPFLGIGLRRTTMGLIGTGQTARAVATIAAGFGMSVIGANRGGAAVPGIELCPLDEVIARSDFLSLHVPLDESTRRILGPERLALMKPTAVLINTCRGELIDQAALVRLLATGKLAGAGLDHLGEASADEIRKLDNVVLTPGIAWYTEESRWANLDEVYENVAAFLAGVPRNVLPVPANITDRMSSMSVATDSAFVPPEFQVPTGLTRDGLKLVPLGPEHNELDYRAWTSSIDHIRQTPGFTDYPWPYPMSLDDNLSDLRQHAEDFRQRVGFTYTAVADDELVGCVYIYPSKNRPGWAAVRSWVRHDHADLDKVLYAMVCDWLDAEWPFEGIEYSPREVGVRPPK
jgi:glycerate dehydrogenase